MSIPPAEVYLAEDFVASSLKVAQLRSILLEHGIPYRSVSKKADLVSIFEAQLKPRRAQILAANASVRPSGRGIVAVSSATGDEALVEPPTPPPAPVAKKRSRPKKSTTAASEEVKPDAELVPEPPAKKPRSRRATEEPIAISSADETPAKPRKSKKAVIAEAEKAVYQTPPHHVPAAIPATAPPAQPALGLPAAKKRSVRPSMAADSALAPPSALQGTKAARKPRASMAAPVKEESEEEHKHKHKPRHSNEDEGSGFSDFNPFQSGSEEAAEKARKRRKSSLGPGETKRRAPRPSEWTATSAPSQIAPPSILRKVGPSAENLRSPPDNVRSALRQHIEYADEQNRVVEEKFGQVTQYEAQVDPETKVVVQQKPTVRKAIIRRKKAPVATPQSLSAMVLGLLLLALASQYKTMSAENGYCDSGSSTNSVIVGREAPIEAAQACIASRSQFQLDHPGVPPPMECELSNLPLVPFWPRPTKCTPCPAHADCAGGEVVSCPPEYILTPNLLAPLGPLVDGWPTVGSRVFPPSCQPDTVRMKQVGLLARQVESELAKGRGAIECSGIQDGRSEGERYGTSETALRDSFADRRSLKLTREAFDEIFDAALKDLVQHGDVIESIDADGVSWYASARTDMTLTCRAKTQATDLLDAWKQQLASAAAVLAAIALFTRSQTAAAEERKRARAVATAVLQRLQDQEHQHYLDPVVTPTPYLPPAQLRDVVIPPGESKSARERLWARVVEQVEKNANVAVREREVRGDVWKTWEWAGVQARRIE